MVRPAFARRLGLLLVLGLCLSAAQGQTPAATPPILDLGLSLGPLGQTLRLGLQDRGARLLVEAQIAEDGPELSGGIASARFILGPIQAVGLCRFLLDPCGEGYRLEAPGGRPFELDGSLEASRLGLLLGGGALGVGAWTGPGLGPVGTLWARAPLAGPLQGGLLAQAFAEAPPAERAWVEPAQVAAPGPAIQRAYALGLGGGGTGVFLAFGASEALRGPRGAALRGEAALSLGSLVLRGAAAARGASWIVPGARLGPARLARVDLDLGRRDRLALSLGARGSAEEGGLPELALRCGLDGARAPWSLGLDAELGVDGGAATGLDAEARLARRTAGLGVSLGAGLDLDLGEAAWGLRPEQRRRLRLQAEFGYHAGPLRLAAALRAQTPPAPDQAAPCSFEASLGLKGPGGELSLECCLDADAEGGRVWTWSLRWRRRLALPLAR